MSTGTGEVAMDQVSVNASMPAKPVVRTRMKLPKAKPNLAEAGRRFSNVSSSPAAKAQPPQQVVPSINVNDAEDELKRPPAVRRVVSLDLENQSIGSSLSTSSSEVNSSKSPSSNPLSSCNVSQTVENDHCDNNNSTANDALSEKPVQTSSALPVTSKSKRRKVSFRSEEKEASVCKRSKRDCDKLEKTQMTMFDLIYWNPSSNPMSYDDETRIPLSDVQTNISESSVSNERLQEEALDNPDDTEQAAADAIEEDAMPVPQVTIGPDGNIILDEKSLVIETTASKKDLSGSPAVYEHSTNTTYASFRKNKQAKNWSDKETAKFFMALSSLGTDFSLMGNLFPNRSRHELKLKFKREEKFNKVLVENAINDPQQFDLSLIDDNDEIENELSTVISKAKSHCKKRDKIGAPQKPKKPKTKPADTKRKRRKKRFHTMQLESDSDDVDESTELTSSNPLLTDELDETLSDITEDIPNCEGREDLKVCEAEEEREVAEDEEECEDDDSLENILRTTRSGRQPKRRSVYTVEVEKKKSNQGKKINIGKHKTNKKKMISSPMQEPVESVLPVCSQVVMLAENSTNGESQVVHLLLYSSPDLPSPLLALTPSKSQSESPIHDHNYSVNTLVEGAQISEVTADVAENIDEITKER